MNKSLNVGDRVRVFQCDADGVDCVGKQGAIRRDADGPFDWLVEFDDGFSELFHEYELRVILNE